MNKTIGNIFKGDKVIWIVFFILCMISLIEVFSASSNLTYKSNNFIMPIMKHALMLVVGGFIAVVITNVPCRYFKLATPFLILVSYLTLLWVLFAGESINGANRVIELGGQTFQPSEIAKGTIILAEAQILSAMQTEKGADRQAFKYILIISLPMIFLIGIENLSTALLLFSTMFLLMFIGRVPNIQLGKLTGYCFLLVLAGVLLIELVGDDSKIDNDKLTKVEAVAKPKKERNAIEKLFHRADTWKGRINKFADKKDIAPEDYDLDKDAQVAHANIAIVSSNVIGKGPGNSVERDFLAQAYSDFIYAIIIEEMGIEGAALVVFLYIILLFRTARIANRCDNNFPAFLCMGLAMMLVIQAAANMLVAVGIVPVTGQPLPLISKGGTSTIINCAYIGAILSVSRTAKKKKEFVTEKVENTDI